MFHFKKPTWKEGIIWLVCATQGASILALCFIFFPTPFLQVVQYSINDTAGKYYATINTIEIYPRLGDSLSENIIVSAHELCHFVWFKKLTEYQREEYILIHNSTMDFVTSYAKKNEKEDFAESCAFYLVKETTWTDAYFFKTEISEDRLTFMKKYVKTLL